MQCHNTDVILSARFSNKLEPLLSLLWQYEEFTQRYLRSESETRGATATQGPAFSAHAMAQTACVHDTLRVHHSRGVKTPLSSFTVESRSGTNSVHKCGEKDVAVF